MSILQLASNVEITQSHVGNDFFTFVVINPIDQDIVWLNICGYILTY